MLGVDPAAAGPTGYGVVESDGRDCHMLSFGTLAASTKLAIPARLCEIHRLLVQLLKQFSPDAMAVESVFAALNMKTALVLAEVRGVVLLAAAEQNIPVHSYAPREVKASVAGYGHATKQQMQLMVRAILGMSVTPEPSDAADALAVALCHIYSAPGRLRLAQAIAPALVQPVPDGTSVRGRSTGVRRPVTTR
ncbi:MAG TPA: crossover junction endodeoxyribonuclease RuvC [Candidatus Acidoferrales bacterium]|nr:crossover junction endodeoxyribonuclease RuvC [Candidatus Acidoferrales bacterium]